MKHILIVSTGGIKNDGITGIIISYLRAMNKEGMNIYVATTMTAEPLLVEQIEKLNCRIIKLPHRKKHLIKYFFSLMQTIRKNHIDVVHVHGNSSTMVIELLAAYLTGCKKRIAHSHNSRCNHPIANGIIHPFFEWLCTDAVACGEAAGKWLFKGKPFIVLKNARSKEIYSYQRSVREQKRRELGVTNELVIGHVGGFVEQKNHQFLVEIFREITKIVSDTKFLLIGDGPLKARIMDETRDIDVQFIGNTDRVHEYLNAMDGMLLPSLFEGIPLVAIEWQLNGLPVVISDTIDDDCAFTDFVVNMSLHDSPAEWAKRLVELINKTNRDNNCQQALEAVGTAGFDIDYASDGLRKLYLN